jgi:hypothetical protein
LQLLFSIPPKLKALLEYIPFAKFGKELSDVASSSSWILAA